MTSEYPYFVKLPNGKWVGLEGSEVEKEVPPCNQTMRRFLTLRTAENFASTCNGLVVPIAELKNH